MKNMDIKLDNFEKTDLDKDYTEALKDPDFKFIVSKLKIDKDILKNYTSTLEDSANELKNCKNCKGLYECKNCLKGHTYLPTIKNGDLLFHYKPCKYKEENVKNTKYLNYVSYISCPNGLKNIFVEDIIKTDKKRFETIKWLNDFIKNYKKNQNINGLYLHGNFGCGKSFLITATLNTLAKEGYSSAVVFWPDFVRGCFNDNFKVDFEFIKKSPILLIDDIGAENLTAWNRDEILCPLLQYRMDAKLPTFFTSNLNMEELEHHLSVSKQDVDVIKAGRIVSRIKQLTDDIEMISVNLRK